MQDWKYLSTAKIWLNNNNNNNNNVHEAEKKLQYKGLGIEI
jgi:hypothetical protein